MRWERPAAVAKDGVQLPSNWLFTHYLEAYNILFRIENALRVFVYVIVKRELAEGWVNINLTSEEGEGESSISAVAKRRMAQAANYGYLCLPTSCPILHLTSGELIR